MSGRSSDQDLERLFAVIKPMFEALLANLKEDPTLAPEFRCPKDSSSRTYKISALLAARPRGTASSGGTTISYSGSSPAVDSLDPGPEPREQGLLFKAGIFVAIAGIAFGVLGPAPSGCVGTLVFIVGCVTGGRAWYMDSTFMERHAAWKKKYEVAQTHWWCEACHEVFQPESKTDAESSLSPSDDESKERSDDDTLNVEPLRRRD